MPPDIDLTPECVAHWFAGDGCGAARGTFVFATNCFRRSEVEMLARRMPVEAQCVRVRRVGEALQQWTISVTRRAEAVKLAALMRPHLPECMLYKLQHVRPPIPHGEHNRKLTTDQVREIRDLEQGGRKQRDIAQMFSVSQHTIWSIARGMHRRKS